MKIEHKTLQLNNKPKENKHEARNCNCETIQTG